MELTNDTGTNEYFSTDHNTGADSFSLSTPPMVRAIQNKTFFLLGDLFSASSGVNWWSLDASGSSIRKVTKSESGIDDVSELSVANILNNVKETFGLTQEDLAFVCNSARKSVINWMNGDKPNKSKTRRMMDLYLIHDEWINTGLLAERRLLDIPVLEGKSIMDLLSNKQLDKDKVLFAGARLLANNTKVGHELKDPFA